MTFDQAKSIYDELEKLKSEELVRLRTDLLRLAAKYANVRAGWNFLRVEERRASSPARTLAHNAFIDACNILSRAVIRDGGSPEWRKRLGQDRQEIGDFACYLACFLGIRER